MRRWQKVNRIPWRGYGIVLAVAAIAGWWLWSPGMDVRDGRDDRGRNGLVLDAGWLADDAWFSAHGGEEAKARHRDPIAVRDLVRKAREHRVTDVFVALPPADAEGRLPGRDAAQTETLLYECYGLRVMPQVGGAQLPLGDARWRTFFVRDVRRLLDQHPRFPGVQLRLPDVKAGDGNFLLLLDEVRAALPAGRTLSVAAGEWDEAWFREVARRADQLMVPLGEAGFSSKMYERAAADRIASALAWSEGKPVLAAAPAAGNLRAALRGVHLGLSRAPVPAHWQGVAIEAAGVPDEDTWRDFRERWVKPGS